MPEDYSHIQVLIDAAPVGQEVKAKAWDAYFGAQDKERFKGSFDKLELPKELKAELWRMKFPPTPKTEVPPAAAPADKPKDTVSPPPAPGTKPESGGLLTTPLVERFAGKEGSKAIAGAAGKVAEFAGDVLHAPGRLLNKMTGGDADPNVQKNNQAASDFNRGLGTGIAETGIEMSSPTNLVLMLGSMAFPAKIAAKIPRLSGLVKAAASGVFSAALMEGIREEFPEAHAAWKKGDFEGVGRATAKSIADLVLLKQAVKGGKKGYNEALAESKPPPPSAPPVAAAPAAQAPVPVEAPKPAPPVIPPGAENALLHSKAAGQTPNVPPVDTGIAASSALLHKPLNPPVKPVTGKRGEAKPVTAPPMQAVKPTPVQAAAPPVPTVPEPTPVVTQTPPQKPGYLPTDVDLDQWFNGSLRVEENMRGLGEHPIKSAKESAEAFGPAETTPPPQAPDAPVARTEPANSTTKASKPTQDDALAAEAGVIRKTLAGITSNPKTLNERSTQRAVQDIIGSGTKFTDPKVVVSALERRLKMIEGEHGRLKPKDTAPTKKAAPVVSETKTAEPPPAPGSVETKPAEPETKVPEPETAPVATEPVKSPVEEPPVTAAPPPAPESNIGPAETPKPKKVEPPIKKASEAKTAEPPAAPGAAPAVDKRKATWLSEKLAETEKLLVGNDYPMNVTIKDAAGKNVLSANYYPDTDGNFGEWIRKSAKRIEEAATFAVKPEGGRGQIMSTYNEAAYAHIR